MANIIKPLKEASIFNSSLTSVFLGGTIDNGNSEDWQDKVCQKLIDFDINIYNPRRNKWEGSWEQSIENIDLKNQIMWELDALDKSDFIIMNLLGDSKSPISLLELGMYAKSGKLIISCPKEFYRYGNIQVVCQKYNIPLFDNIDDSLNFFIKNHLTKK